MSHVNYKRGETRSYVWHRDNPHETQRCKGKRVSFKFYKRTAQRKFRAKERMRNGAIPPKVVKFIRYMYF